MTMIVPVNVVDPALGGSTSPALGGGQANVFDVQAFRNSMQQAQLGDTAPQQVAALGNNSSGEALKNMLSPLQMLNNKGAEIGTRANELSSGVQEMTPSNMVMLTMEAHEFLFRAEITANVANRSSDGIQQLFRQQS